jgi:orotidine-5'-phosphate decarboxylase
MTQTFREKWLETVDRKNSVLCAGLDPAEYEMGRIDEGLPPETGKLDWAMKYVSAVAPFCAAIKPNLQYWKNNYGMDSLEHITQKAHELGMVVIDDSKLADIGSTNDAGMYHAQVKHMDAITLACFAGNIKEAAGQLKSRDLGGIHMCLMSNPDYAREKNKLVQISEEEIADYSQSLVTIDGKKYVPQFIQLAHDSKKFGLDGVVIGAPSKKNHITEAEIAIAKHYAGDEMLVLLPGVGAQGGEANAIWKYFTKENVIVNVGRAVMFPKGSNSTSEDHAEAARLYQKMLNELRAA